MQISIVISDNNVFILIMQNHPPDIRGGTNVWGRALFNVVTAIFCY
ncbi:hypothetical protein CIT292_07398 [Citrobacter youngae ATCC 29220]|uniref:Uncharacterized protein n=1 Tax=Citrobacter youngae ATCC 29220 TaxID=500640 RepID=D4BAA4_9ENTR|nr:hypothetical protein CIT292_07398 [Citrobacter youngae ATCC 29220]